MKIKIIKGNTHTYRRRIKKKKKKTKKENSTELQKANVEAEVIKSIKSVIKSLIRFHSANKINYYNKRVGEKKKEKIPK